jgi:biotin carboxyl carrier protein
MVRAVIIDDVPLSVELLDDGRIRVDDRVESVSIAGGGPGRLSIICGTRSYVARLAGNHVFVGCRRLQVRVVDPRAFARGARHSPSEGKQTLTAPMPGRVVRILKRAGERVEPGDGIVVVEAMKMQNELKASEAGTVASISAAEGDAVSAGQVLATIEQNG